MHALKRESIFKEHHMFERVKACKIWACFNLGHMVVYLEYSKLLLLLLSLTTTFAEPSLLPQKTAL